jgi:hypothetical protein
MVLSHAYNNGELFSEMCTGFKSNAGEDATEFNITKEDWGQLKAGITFQEYLSCDNDVTCEVQMLELNEYKVYILHV